MASEVWFFCIADCAASYVESADFTCIVSGAQRPNVPNESSMRNSFILGAQFGQSAIQPPVAHFFKRLRSLRANFLKERARVGIAADRAIRSRQRVSGTSRTRIETIRQLQILQCVLRLPRIQKQPAT